MYGLVLKEKKKKEVKDTVVKEKGDNNKDNKYPP